jgi:hypothetical protein
MMPRLLVIPVLVLAIGSFGVPQAEAAPCKGDLKGCGATVVVTKGEFQGAIVVPGSARANQVVAASHGCDGCVWTLVLNCDRNTTNDPEWVSCNAAWCPRGSLYRLYLQRPEDVRPEFVDAVCLTATQRIVTADELAVDAARYLTDLAPPAMDFAVQPDGRAVTRVATFFYARGSGSDERTLDVDTPAGPARLAIHIAPSEYRWTFGDGGRCTTAEPGGTYDGRAEERCDDRVAHVYDAAGTWTVTLAATWSGTYTFDVGYGAVGPRTIPGAGVAGPVATRTVPVREARAELVGG